MPQRAPGICRDCNRTAIAGSPYCSAHQQSNRASTSARDREQRRRRTGLKGFYDSGDWRDRTRPFILARDPMCRIAVLCGGNAPSTDVDHIIRAERYIAQHGGDCRFFYDPANLRGACHEDHAGKTAIEQRGLWMEGPPHDAAAGSPPRG